MLQAVPLKENLAALYVYLLGDPAPHRPVLRTADRGEVCSCGDVGRQERGVLGGDEELVQVPKVAVASADPGYLLVRVIEEDILADAVPVNDPTLPPGEHGSTLVVLQFEVPRGPVLAKPHELPEVIDQHRAVLTGALLQRDKDVSGGRSRSLFGHLDGCRAQVRARAKGSHVLRGCG